MRLLTVAALSVVLTACNIQEPASTAPTSARMTSSSEAVSATTQCSEGDTPETDIQGRVPLKERNSGRSTQGYNCNLKRIGQFQGEGATWVSASHKECAYMATAFAGTLQKKLPGVQVIDVSNPSKPTFVKSLDSIAFAQGTWETLKVNTQRQLLAGVAVGPINDVLFFDIYDISGDCKQPKLLNAAAGKITLPANFIGHEGNFSPDGKTYWATSAGGGAITAIDITDPSRPKLLYISSSLYPNHGMNFSADGKRMYLTSAAPAGLIILDISDIQDRKSVPLIRMVSTLNWSDGDISQHTLPVFYNGVPHVFVVDEFGTGGARLVNIADERKPRIVSQLRLAIQLPENANKRRDDLGNNGLFGYEGHYCEVDKKDNPTRLACGYFQSGVRVFDVSSPLRPREIAYYNPPAQSGKAALLPGSEHTGVLVSTLPSVSDARNLGIGIPSKAGLQADLSTDWCSSPPRFVGNQLWVTCQDNGFMVLEFTGAQAQ